MANVLLLNATYEPLSVLSLRRAAKLLLKERAEPVATDSLPLVGPERTLSIPTVLRLKFYVNVPRRNPPAWTRRGLLARDQLHLRVLRQTLRLARGHGRPRAPRLAWWTVVVGQHRDCLLPLQPAQSRSHAARGRHETAHRTEAAPHTLSHGTRRDPFDLEGVDRDLRTMRHLLPPPRGLRMLSPLFRNPNRTSTHCPHYGSASLICLWQTDAAC